MFDNIKVQVDLPLPEELAKTDIQWKEYTFQTKDLDNCLGEYWISKEGKLFEHVVEREYVPFTKEELKTKNVRPWELWKDVIEKEARDVEQSYHGSITFYTYEEYPTTSDQKELKDFWVEFVAYFIYGQLDKIELKQFRFEQSHKQFNKKWEEEHQKRLAHPWTKFKTWASKYGWRQFWNFASKACYQASKTFDSVRIFIYKHIL